MTKHQEILNFISEVRDSHSQMINIFSLGSCFNFYLILRRVWPEAKPFYDINHVVTEIDGRYYDITGDVTVKVNHWKMMRPFFGIYPQDGTRRAISQMRRAEFGLLTEWEVAEAGRL